MMVGPPEGQVTSHVSVVSVSESKDVSAQLPAVLGLHTQVKVTGAVYQLLAHGCGADPSTAHMAVMLLPHAPAPPASKPTSVNATTSASRLMPTPTSSAVAAA